MASLQICSISEELKEKMKKFKFRKEQNNAAIILKINKETQSVEEEEDYEDLDVDELQNELPEHQPRYVLLSYVHKTKDGRTMYPLFFIFVSPQGCQPDLTMMYAGTKLAVAEAAKITKVYEVRSVDELTEDFIKEKLVS
ncbi:glia maturation factor gamma-like [Babylonia areolata]|uniref:glia maturation factor gamma-like n=1 Tax=Babylonia areolata TaxID=304850 RepID=UPI003FD4FF69